MEILQPDELERIERDHARGLSARVIVDIFRPKGVRLSEATFRKYVQAGLLPRSRRVGQKGKHRGSQGVYPVDAVRRINAIKRMMAEGYTLEDIKRSFVFFKGHIDQAERELQQVFEGFEALATRLGSADKSTASLRAALVTLRMKSKELVRDATRLGSALTAHQPSERLS
jgi:DNA-binding transcriptional MerR regulator